MATVQSAYGGVDINLDVSGNKIYYVDNGGPPTSGTYNLGDLAFVVPVPSGTAPNNTSALCYRCTTAGTPGTWTALGAPTAGGTDAQDAITAHAGGGQASAFQLTATISRITTAAATTSPFDSVKLPASVPGANLIVINSGANPIQVYGTSPDTINDVATGTGITQGANTILEFACSVAGKWYSIGDWNFQATNILDSNGATSVVVGATTSAVNQLTIANAAANHAPAISATGTDSAIGLMLTSKSTGKITFNGAAVSYSGINYIASETGTTNAIAGALTDANGAAIPAIAGLRVSVLLAHGLQAGANTFNLNATGTASIVSSRNPGSNLATAYVSTGIIDLIYTGTVWACVGE